MLTANYVWRMLDRSPLICEDLFEDGEDWSIAGHDAYIHVGYGAMTRHKNVSLRHYAIASVSDVGRLFTLTDALRAACFWEGEEIVLPGVGKVRAFSYYDYTRELAWALVSHQPERSFYHFLAGHPRIVKVCRAIHAGQVPATVLADALLLDSDLCDDPALPLWDAAP